nr:hypothetical protein [Tanacetum cinerariifolium]
MGVTVISLQSNYYQSLEACKHKIQYGIQDESESYLGDRMSLWAEHIGGQSLEEYYKRVPMLSLQRQ